MCFLLHPVPQAPHLNLRLMAATAFKVIGNEVAEGRKETKTTKFILCLFSMAVLSENSQVHEFWAKISYMHRGISCRRCFAVLCIGKGKSGKLQETSSVKKMVLKT